MPGQGYRSGVIDHAGKEVALLKTLEFCRPSQIDEALELLAQKKNCKIIAGGTDLVIALNERTIRPDCILDISGIESLSRIYENEGVLHIGAMARFSQIQNSALVAKFCPALCSAASQVGAVQIRNIATIGGNVANAATAADSIPSLLSVNALAVIASYHGRRTVPVSEIVVGINKNSLQENELIEEFLLPFKPGYAMVFEKIGRRKALAIARINLALCARVQDGHVADAAVAVGAVNKTAYRVLEVEQFLQGKTLESGVIEQAAVLMDETVARNLAGRPTTPYKRKIAYAVLKRAMEKMAGGEGLCCLE